MKNVISLAIGIAFAIQAFAQAPASFNYQAVARDASGAVLPTKSISVRVSILDSILSGPSVYVEHHAATTNQFGLFALSIGSGVVEQGAFSAIQWSKKAKFLKVEFDPSGGTNYSISSTTQLLSVPYALYAATSNEQQKLELKNDSLKISSGNGVKLPKQLLSLKGDTLSISEGNSVVMSNTTKGKGVVIISGDISDQDAATQIEQEIGEATQEVYVQDAINLTTLDLSRLKSPILVQISGNPELKSINLSGLETVRDLTIANLLKLETIDLSKLNTALSIGVTGTLNLLKIEFPSLKISNVVNIRSNEKLNEVGLPALSVCMLGIDIGANPLLGSVRFDQLLRCGSIGVDNSNLLEEIQLPKLIYAGAMSFSDNVVLKAVSFPLFQLNGETYSSNYYFKGNALPSSLINTILSQFTSFNQTIVYNCTLNLGQQSPSAPPTGQGLTDKQALINRGWSVITD